MKKNFSKVEEAIHQACSELQLRVYLLEWTPKGVQVYVDKLGALIGIDDCKRVSKRVRFFLMADDLLDDVELEVSSPGLERKLKHSWHFTEALDKEIHVKTNQPVEGLQVFNGELVEASSEYIKISQKEQVYQIPFENIKQAHLIFEIKKQKKATSNKKQVSQ